MRRHAILQILTFISLCGADAVFATAPPPQTLTMTFSQSAIVITGAVSSHPILLVGVAREPRGYINRIQNYEARLVDTTGTGSVSYPFNSTLSFRSIWLAVDLVSGASVSGHPNGYAVTAMQSTQDRLKRNVAGEVAQVSAPCTLCQFVVIRPGTGVWSETVASRGSLDDGNEEGSATVSLGRLAPDGETSGAPPQTLQAGDVVFVVDSFHAAYSLLTVGE